jgi:Family of unknown function (DUF6892)
MRFGDVIGDAGLRLGLVEQWLQGGVMPDSGAVFDSAVAKIGEDAELWLEEEGGRKIDFDEPSNVDQILTHAVNAFAELEIEQPLLDRITTLHFDGGNDVYCDLLLEELSTRLKCEHWELDTGGETEVFAVASLGGIQALSKLESLNMDGHGFIDGGHDLSPLAGHPALRELILTGIASGADTLLSLNALTKLRGTRGLGDDVRAALVDKSVDVA